MLADKTKFKPLAEDPTIKREEKLIRCLLKLLNEKKITQEFYKDVRPNGSQPARLYGLAKVHKNNHPLRPICSSVNSFNYKLSSELAKILSPYATNQYTIRNTFTFVDELQGMNSTSCHIASFDVSSLFTSIPLDTTITIALDYLYENATIINGSSRNEFKSLLEMATKETNFIFNGKCYDQIDGVAMGSPLAPVLANIFMRNFEEKAFENCPIDIVKPSFYRRYVDDSFLLFKDQAHVTPFFNYLNTRHKNIVFTKEEELTSTESFPFLDAKIVKEDGKFLTSTYYKPTHTGVYTNWYSFTPRKYKINLIKNLLNRAWKICSNERLFLSDWEIIKKTLVKNKYPEKLLVAMCKNFVQKMKSSDENESVSTVAKKEVKLYLPFHGKSSDVLHKQLTSLLADTYPQVDLKIIFRTTFRLSNLFTFKDKIPLRLRSFVVYGVHCTDCESYYIGKTKRHIATRYKEHRNVERPTAVTRHLLSTGHDVSLADMKVYEKGKTDEELYIKESLIIRDLKPDLNKTVSSYPLELF